MDRGAGLKSIFEYDDYRVYLRDYYAHSKTYNSKFSYRYFARLGGFKSGNILKIVMDGKINIVPETAERFCKALKLDREEAAFFKCLVLFNQAATTEERQTYSKALLRSRTYKKFHPLSELQYRYFDIWYYPVVRGLVALPGFKEDPEWIAGMINPPITATEAKSAIEALTELGLLSRNESGNLVQSNTTVTTSSAIISSSLATYHREMMKRAAESIDRVPRHKRDLSALTLDLSQETAKLIGEMLEKFRREVVEVASRDQNIDSVYQLNIYLFPVSHTVGEGEGQS